MAAITEAGMDGKYGWYRTKKLHSVCHVILLNDLMEY